VIASLLLDHHRLPPSRLHQSRKDHAR
jgi:hypothetical protein